jgi:hypothetical protein
MLKGMRLVAVVGALIALALAAYVGYGTIVVLDLDLGSNVEDYCDRGYRISVLLGFGFAGVLIGAAAAWLGVMYAGAGRFERVWAWACALEVAIVAGWLVAGGPRAVSCAIGV